MTNSENWFTLERLACVRDAAHRAAYGNFIIDGHEEWVAHAEPTPQEQRTPSSSTPPATNG